MSGKKKTILIVALLLVVFIGSISYALWSVTLEQTDSNIVKTGCFTVDMVEQTDEINLPEEYPVTDAEGRKYSPFTFTIQNTCTIDSSYSVNLKVEDGTTLEHQYVKAVLDGDKAQVLTDYEKATDEDKYQLTTGTLAGASSEGAEDGESVTYNLRLWLDADTPETQMSKDFYAKIVIENITTTVPEREVLATGDISETEADNVTYTLYSTGELEINGTGRMRASNNMGIGSEIATVLIAQDEIMSTLTNEEQAVLASEQSLYLMAVVTDNYKVFSGMAKKSFGKEDLCATQPETYEEYKSCLKELGVTDTNFYSLMDKLYEKLPKITSVEIEEGITNIGDGQLASIKLKELILPATIEELGSYSLTYVEVPYLAIPNNVVSIGGTLIALSSIDEIKLPKNTTFTSISENMFYAAENVSIVIPETITDGFNANNFSEAKNITLNFECSEENAPSGVADLVSSGIVTEVNYNYEIES